MTDVQTFAERRKRIETIARMFDYATRNVGTVEGGYAAAELEDEIEANLPWIIEAAQEYYKTGSTCCWCHSRLQEKAK